MIAIMEMGSGKVEDEARGVYGEDYGDEVLYAGWAEAPRVAARGEEALVRAPSQPGSRELDGFLAHLYACQE
ncbi:MAG: hypothetical protein HY777_14365 [Betaproteobacteria bacterium]|nr:hypothetical protein [Betaproteobacteria bacterium]